jgi:hypothetical protein
MTSAQAIEDIMAHLGAILMQASATDDAIILEHVRDAHDIARVEYRRQRDCDAEQEAALQSTEAENG